MEQTNIFNVFFFQFQTDVSRQIKQPMDEYKKFVNRFFSPFGPFEIKASSKEGGAVEKLRSETKAFLDQLGTSMYYVINCKKGDGGLFVHL